MLILVIVLVLKDSLRTFFKPLSLSWSLGVRSLSWSLGVRSLSCPGPCGSGPCPYPCPCGLVLVLVLVFSPCKDLFPLFHYSDYSHIIVVSMHTISFNYTYLCLSCRHIALRL